MMLSRRKSRGIFKARHGFHRIKEEVGREFEEVVAPKCRAEFETLEKAEREKLQKESDDKIKEYEKELQTKYEKDKEELQKSYNSLIEETSKIEKQKADIEIQQYRAKVMKPTASLANKMLVSNLESEKQALMKKHEDKLAELKKEAQQRLEREKKQALAEHQKELQNMEREAKQQLELKLAQLRSEKVGGETEAEEKKRMEKELADLESELADKLTNLKNELEEKYKAEKQRRSESATKALQDYEEELRTKYEADAAKIRQDHEKQKVTLRNELEQRKQRMEAEKNEKLAGYKAMMDRKVEEKTKQLEFEKAKVLDDLQNKIQALNIGTADKENLANNLQNARMEKENKQVELQELERQIEDERRQAQMYSGKIRELRTKIEELKSKAALVQFSAYNKKQQAEENRLIEEKNRKVLINSLKTEIASKEQQINDLKAKIDAQRVKQEDMEKSLNKSIPTQEKGPTLAKIADEINELKQLVSGKKEHPEEIEEIGFEDFAPMEKLESDSEDEKISQKVNEWKRLKAEVAREKGDIKADQEEVNIKKTKWRDALMYLRSNYIPDMEDRKSELMEEKAEIDSQIKAINQRIESNKIKAQKVKEMEIELRPYLNRKENQKESFRRLLNFEEKPGAVQTQDDFFNRPPEFEDLESIGFSSEHDAQPPIIYQHCIPQLLCMKLDQYTKYPI
eukprot:TRINITY_DN70977_c1_g1_i1.p1 TRINITY_DN70977_c1_g1~~TRINITY_DN70977_c1_g1_i1.p1  ORF type:complete len:685 (-),score=174.03 TRINITY_DN70977_c1_g1_i1:6891-8945(-)